MTVEGPDAASGDALNGSRTIAFRWERDMLEPLREAAPALIGGGTAAESFTEVPSAMGVPDLSIVVWNIGELARRRSLGLAPVTDLLQVRLLLAASNGLELLSELAQACAVSVPYLRRAVVPVLAAAGWVDELDGRVDRGPGARVRLRHSLLPLANRVVTVEAKRSRWQQAMHQAMRHGPSVDIAYVALDAARAAPAVRQAKAIARLGVGLLTVSAVTGQVEVVARPAAVMTQQPLRQVLSERCWALREAGLDGLEAPAVFGRVLS